MLPVHARNMWQPNCSSCSDRLATMSWQKTPSQHYFTTTASCWRSTSRSQRLRCLFLWSGGRRNPGQQTAHGFITSHHVIITSTSYHIMSSSALHHITSSHVINTYDTITTQCIVLHYHITIILSHVTIASPHHITLYLNIKSQNNFMTSHHYIIS